MDHQRISQQALYWQVPGYKRGPGRPRANWRSTVNKYLDKRWGSPGKKQRWQLLTDTDGVEVWPNVSSWMRDEPRSKVKCCVKFVMLFDFDLTLCVCVAADITITFSYTKFRAAQPYIHCNSIQLSHIINNAGVDPI